MTVSALKNRIQRFLGTFIVLTLILDSGGERGMRTLGLFLGIFMIGIDLLRNKINFSVEFLLVWLFIAAHISFTMIFSVLKDVPLVVIVTYNFSLYFFVVLYLLVKNRHIKTDDFMNASLLFSILILVISVGTIFNVDPIIKLRDFCVENFSGLYGQKPILGLIFKNIYFQGTLNLVMPCVYFIFKNKKLKFIFTFLALVFSLSRFGVLVCLLAIFLKSLKKTTVPFYILLFAFTVLYFAFWGEESFLSRLFLQDEGMQIRIGHIRGISELFDNPFIFLFGQGPGTKYYSYGFRKYADSIEVSQADFLRKYGLLFSCVLTFLFCYLLKKIKTVRSKDSAPLFFTLFCFYLVAFSNPVLLSLPYILFVSICIVHIEKKKRHCI